MEEAIDTATENKFSERVCPMLRHLIIDKFRGFSHLELHDLGRVNLLVGTNNCGKTSVLEAIELLVSRGHAESIFSTAFRRGERLQAGTASRPQIGIDLCRLFHNFELEASSAFRIAGMADTGWPLSRCLKKTPSAERERDRELLYPHSFVVH